MNLKQSLLKQIIREEVKKVISEFSFFGSKKFKAGDIVRIKDNGGDPNSNNLEKTSRQISSKYKPKEIDGTLHYYVTAQKNWNEEYTDEERQGDTFGARWVPEDVIKGPLNPNLETGINPQLR